jgi:hypothetical protein
MTTPYLTDLLAAEHRARLRQDAATARLAAIARCCRSSAWARALRGAAPSAAGPQRALRRDRVSAASCCARA